MEPTSTHYRIYVTDRRGRITCGHDRFCASDDDACTAARQLMTLGMRVEIWKGREPICVLHTDIRADECGNRTS
jgi:hypothetical protein